MQLQVEAVLFMSRMLTAFTNCDKFAFVTFVTFVVQAEGFAMQGHRSARRNQVAAP